MPGRPVRPQDRETADRVGRDGGCLAVGQGKSVFHATAVARTSAKVCADPIEEPPVRSMLPIGRPVTGSCTGTAVHVHGRTSREKCSCPSICTSRSRASAVPGALVPAPCSLQSRRERSSSRPPCGSLGVPPSTHSMVPSAAVTATTTPRSRRRSPPVACGSPGEPPPTGDRFAVPTAARPPPLPWRRGRGRRRSPGCAANSPQRTAEGASDQRR